MKKGVIALALAAVVAASGFCALNAKASDLKYNYGSKEEKKQGVLVDNVKSASKEFDSAQLQVTSSKDVTFSTGESACVHGWYDNDSIVYSDSYDSKNAKIRNLVTGKEQSFNIPGTVEDYRNKKLLVSLDSGVAVYDMETKQLKKIEQSSVMPHKKFADEKGNFIISDNCDNFVLIEVSTGKTYELNYSLTDDPNLSGDSVPSILLSEDEKTVYYAKDGQVMKCSLSNSKSASKVADFSSLIMHKNLDFNQMFINKTADENIITVSVNEKDGKHHVKTVNLSTGAAEDIQGLPADAYIIDKFISSNKKSKVNMIVYENKTKDGADLCCGELSDGKVIKSNVIEKNGVPYGERSGWYAMWSLDSNRLFVRLMPGKGNPDKYKVFNISK